MQLEQSAIRRRLGTAACMLLASAAKVRADSVTPSTVIDASGLYYGEQQRTMVAEPQVRVTRLFSNGQSLSGQIGLDVITGASPTGATPSGQDQVITTTSASGTSTQTIQASTIPTHEFQDHRFAGDVDWTVPVGSLFSATTGFHYSSEEDYQSLGANATFSLDVFQRMVTLTAGAGINRDRVDPVGGTVEGLTDGTVIVTSGPNPKDVNNVMVGVTRVLSRRWLMGVSATREVEKGYLTEPYKVLSVLDPATGFPLEELREKRPDLRTRTSVLGSSTYHFTQDVLYSTYRYYWDDWGVNSHTLDFKYRHDLPNGAFLQPHVRAYAQTAADFFRPFLIQGEPLPAFASSDQRVGDLRTATIGLGYGFRLPNAPGEWSVRAEYMMQWGKGHPADAPGVQANYDLSPPVHIGSVLVSYSLGF